MLRCVAQKLEGAVNGKSNARGERRTTERGEMDGVAAMRAVRSSSVFWKGSKPTRVSAVAMSNMGDKAQSLAQRTCSECLTREPNECRTAQSVEREDVGGAFPDRAHLIRHGGSTRSHVGLTRTCWSRSRRGRGVASSIKPVPPRLSMHSLMAANDSLALDGVRVSNALQTITDARE